MIPRLKQGRPSRRVPVSKTKTWAEPRPWLPFTSQQRPIAEVDPPVRVHGRQRTT
ncbi:hypothetical protein BGZ94_000724, partial [Podila epigama]